MSRSVRCRFDSSPRKRARHVEVQGDYDADFPQRKFVYNYLFYDRYGRPVVSLAVLGAAVAAPIRTFGYQGWEVGAAGL
jgi:hypothetical protein